MKFKGNLTQAMKDYISEKTQRLAKYVDDLDSLDVKYRMDGEKYKLEMSLDNNLRASKIGEDFYALVPLVVEQLDGQIRRYRTSKIFNKRKSNIRENFEVEDSFDSFESKITREKLLYVDALSEDEAIEMMESLAHSFFIYKDINRENKICVVYLRSDNTYGVIICQ